MDVFFEVERLHINDPDAIRLLTIYASLFQNESEDKSAAIRWSFRVRFHDGSSGFADRVCYGYVQGENGNLIPDPARAEIVRAIFAWHNNGLSFRAIAAQLKEHGIPSPRGNPVWHIETVRIILNNEKYYGDVLVQIQTIKTGILQFHFFLIVIFCGNKLFFWQNIFISFTNIICRNI